jgi:hypothetical protein
MSGTLLKRLIKIALIHSRSSERAHIPLDEREEHLLKRLPEQSTFEKRLFLLPLDNQDAAGLSNSPFCRLRRLGEEGVARTPRAPAKG